MSGTAMGKTSQEIIDGCWAEGGHPAMAACVEKYKHSTEVILSAAEKDISNDVTAYAGTSVYSAITKDALESSIKALQEYRRAECEFQALATMGNASDSIKLACEAELNEKRVNQLREDGFWCKSVN